MPALMCLQTLCCVLLKSITAKAEAKTYFQVIIVRGGCWVQVEPCTLLPANNEAVNQNVVISVICSYAANLYPTPKIIQAALTFIISLLYQVAAKSIHSAQWCSLAATCLLILVLWTTIHINTLICVILMYQISASAVRILLALLSASEF